MSGGGVVPIRPRPRADRRRPPTGAAPALPLIWLPGARAATQPGWRSRAGRDLVTGSIPAQNAGVDYMHRSHEHADELAIYLFTKPLDARNRIC